MFTLVKHKLTNKYSTIYTKDLQQFLNLKSFFATDFKFEVIQDIKEVKEILDKLYTSHGRGEEYNEDLPSSTKLVSLCPINIQNDKFLLKWLNDTPVQEQEVGKDDILSRGTLVHYILEQFITDKEARLKDKPLIEKLKILKSSKKPSKKIEAQIDKKIISDIRRYIQMAYIDEEILRKVHNLDELKEEFEFLATKHLLNFIKNELIYTDLVYSEIFISIDNFVQGSIDCVCYKDGVFTILDYKTTSSMDKKTGKPKFKTNSPQYLRPYAQQLYVYNTLLEKSDMTHCFKNEHPEFKIVQIHLLNGQYKIFDIPWGLIQSQGKVIDKVLNWYWDIRNDNYTPESQKEDELEENYDLLTI